MTRLLVHVEGQTEETFVREILRPHLYLKGFNDVSARLMATHAKETAVVVYVLGFLLVSTFLITFVKILHA